MIKLDVREKLLRAQQYQEDGKDEQAVDTLRGIFEPLIRRDGDELEIDDLFDLIAVAAYSAERATQLFELVEKELEKRAPEDQEDIRKNIAFMRGCAMCFLKIVD